jgi:ABC-type uncharacterized transport system substrate-binding protein
MQLRQTAYPAVAAAFVGLATPAMAHPHVFVDATETAVFENGKLVGIRHDWKFDEPFSSFATQGLGPNKDGKPTAAELAVLSKVNVDSLAMFGFFTRVAVNGADRDVLPPIDNRLDFDGKRLSLHFTLPLKVPAESRSETTLSVFDPTYFVGFEFGPEPTAILAGAPPTCTSKSRTPQSVGQQMMARLSTLPMDVRELPPDLRAAVAQLAYLFIVDCK